MGSIAVLVALIALSDVQLLADKLNVGGEPRDVAIGNCNESKPVRRLETKRGPLGTFEIRTDRRRSNVSFSYRWRVADSSLIGQRLEHILR